MTSYFKYHFCVLAHLPVKVCCTSWFPSKIIFRNMSLFFRSQNLNFFWACLAFRFQRRSNDQISVIFGFTSKHGLHNMCFTKHLPINFTCMTFCDLTLTLTFLGIWPMYTHTEPFLYIKTPPVFELGECESAVVRSQNIESPDFDPRSVLDLKYSVYFSM